MAGGRVHSDVHDVRINSRFSHGMQAGTAIFLALHPIYKEISFSWPGLSVPYSNFPIGECFADHCSDLLRGASPLRMFRSRQANS